jgi:hypothetical protein
MEQPGGCRAEWTGEFDFHWQLDSVRGRHAPRADKQGLLGEDSHSPL